MNQKPLLIAIATLIVAIFAFAQVYIIFTVTTINDRINSVDQRLTHLIGRFAQLNIIVNLPLIFPSVEWKQVNREIHD